jgi:DAACS family dicarboxylate/amino acid:cation (Na+ or H+) symporter
MTPPLKRRLPLSAQVLLAVVLGSVMGMVFHTGPIIAGLRNEDLGQLGLLVIRLLKALAIPLILFAILDSFLRTRVTARRGGKLLVICLVNVSVAFLIGITLMNVFKPGEHWRGRIEQLERVVHAPAPAAAPRTTGEAPTLNPIKNISGYIPESVVDPFTGRSNVISVVLLALLGGAALRRVKERQQEAGETTYLAVERFVETGYQTFVLMLEWVVQIVPFAVFGLVARVVGEAGIEVFSSLWVFLVTMLAGLAIHSLIYYPLVAWFVGRKPPQVYVGRGADAILTGLSCNSSLATVPITLKCLTERMGVSQQSARLAACIGTNLNNDGITLYEAMAALFLALAFGFDLGLGQQAVVVLASLMAGAGVAGIPEAGLIVLPLVLSAAGLPEAVVAAAIPLIVPVDWIIARARSGVNVMSDMLVAILLDAGEKTLEPVEAVPAPEAGLPETSPAG